MLCGDPVLPPVVTDFCAPKVRKAQVTKLFITRATSADVLTDVEDAEEWADRLSDSAVIPGSGAAPIRTLPVIGSYSEPEVTESDISLGRKYRSEPVNTLPFRIDDLSLENIDLVRDYQEAGAATVKFWFEAGGLIWGGNSGIDATIKAGIVIPEASTDFITGSGNLVWNGVIPQAHVSPFA